MQTKEYFQEYYKKNKKTIINQAKKYYKNNRKKCINSVLSKRRLHGRKYYKRKTPISLQERIHKNISKSINVSLHGNKSNSPWKELVGYDIKKLKERIECQFLPGMSWENYGEWHIDHKKPKVLFNFKTKYDNNFKNCWLLANLQPLWAKDNLVKNRFF